MNKFFEFQTYCLQVYLIYLISNLYIGHVTLYSIKVGFVNVWTSVFKEVCRYNMNN